MSLKSRIKKHRSYLAKQVIISFKVRSRQFAGEVFSRAILRSMVNAGILKMQWGMFKNGQIRCIWEKK